MQLTRSISSALSETVVKPFEFLSSRFDEGGCHTSACCGFSVQRHTIVRRMSSHHHRLIQLARSPTPYTLSECSQKVVVPPALPLPHHPVPSLALRFRHSE